MIDYSAIIKFHRKKSGLSQIELAELAGLGKTVIYDMEKGKTTIKLTSLLKVCEVLNIQIDFQSPLMASFKDQQNEKS